MATNVLITGAPGTGKTSLIKHLMRDLTPVVLRGFYKEEIYENQTCKGFRTITFDLHEQILAHVYLEGPSRMGPFGVNIDGFEKLILPQFINLDGVELIIIDEIGRMECLSTLFCDKLTDILDSKIPLIATLDPHVLEKFDNLQSRTDVRIMWINQKNRNDLWKNVILELD